MGSFEKISQRPLAQKKGLGFKFFGCCHSLKRSVNKNDSFLIILLLIKTNINYTHLHNIIKLKKILDKLIINTLLL